MNMAQQRSMLLSSIETGLASLGATLDEQTAAVTAKADALQQQVEVDMRALRDEVSSSVQKSLCEIGTKVEVTETRIKMEVEPQVWSARTPPRFCTPPRP